MVANLSYSPSPRTTRWSVACPGVDPVEVQAENWVTALGLGIQAMRMDTVAGRLAAEVLPNGVIIAHELCARRRYVISRL